MKWETYGGRKAIGLVFKGKEDIYERKKTTPEAGYIDRYIAG